MKPSKPAVLKGLTLALSCLGCFSAAGEDQPSPAAPKPSLDDSKAWRREILPIDNTLGHVEGARKLLHHDISTADAQRLGKIENIVVVPEMGRILYALVNIGGAPGGGARQVAIPPMVFTQVPPDSTPILLSVEKQKLLTAPALTSEKSIPGQLTDVAFAKKIYDYFQSKPWWDEASTTSGSFSDVRLVSDVIGLKIENAPGEPLGKVEEVMLDLPPGRLVYVMLSPDRNLNPGENFYALPPGGLNWTDQKLLVNLSQERLAVAPHINNEQWAILSNPTWAAHLYTYYGQHPYFQGEHLEPTGQVQPSAPVVRDLPKNH